MQTVLITGASSGIGLETAILFSEKGWNVAAAIRNFEKSGNLAKYKNVNCFRMDVTDRTSIVECVGQVIKKYGKIDALINNAGIYETGPLELTADEMIEGIVKTNINGVIFTAKAILPHFRQNKNGVIVNVSSIAGRVTFPFQSVYHSTKWAIEGFSESLRYELASLNIKIKLVEPGVVKTNLYVKTNEKDSEKYPEEYAVNFKNWHRFLMKNLQKGYLPGRDAETIFEAVTDNKNKLRYTTDFTTRAAILLHSFFPVNYFQKIISRQSKLKIQ